MKKILSVLAVLFVLGTANVFAKGSTGIGAQVGYPLGGALTFKVSSLPCVFALDFNMQNEALGIGLTADWWLANPKIEGTWGYYYGVGLFGGLGVGGENFAASAGARALIGTNVFLVNNFIEIYLQGGWEPKLTIANSGISPSFAEFFGNFGFRFWF